MIFGIGDSTPSITTSEFEDESVLLPILFDVDSTATILAPPALPYVDICLPYVDKCSTVCFPTVALKCAVLLALLVRFDTDGVYF